MMGPSRLEKIGSKTDEDVSLSGQRRDPKHDRTSADRVGAKSTPRRDH